jgi:hypothetical protein
MTPLLALNPTPTGSASVRRTGIAAAAVLNVCVDKCNLLYEASLQQPQASSRSICCPPLTILNRPKRAIQNPDALFNAHRSILAARAVRAG